jgi:hypothetical protein
MVVWISASALLLSLAAFAYAWKLQQELHSATRRLDRYNRALFDAHDEIRRLHETLAETAAQVRVGLKRNHGHMSFEPEMTVREAQLVHPQVQQILAGFHLGGCSSCAVEPDDTLAQICAEHGQDIQLLIQNLNLLLDGGNGHNGAALQPVKVPNVAIDF